LLVILNAAKDLLLPLSLFLSLSFRSAAKESASGFVVVFKFVIPQRSEGICFPS
jgi:hypothetical protein